MNLESAVNSANEMMSWVHQNTNEISLPKNEKENYAASIFQHALDIGDAIVILVSKNLIGPAFTLARSHLDSYICGLWLLNCADDNQFENYKNERYPTIQTMLKAIDDKPETGGAWIKTSAELNLQSFHALTHAGVEHVVRRNLNSGAIEPSYPEEEIMSLLQHSIEIQIGTCAYLFGIANNPDKMDILSDKVSEYRAKL
jgi:Family of unknown function (DUF6988)